MCETNLYPNVYFYLTYYYLLKLAIMKCPTCNETLLISDKNGIEIDYCPSCRGIWLDRGELDKIIERSADHYSKKENVERDFNPYGRDSRDGHGYERKHYKKKSFLGDLFDF